MNRKRRLAGLAVAAAVVLAVGWSVRGAKAQSGAPGKNIQVLKDVPADQIFPTMQFISISLGVECEFCHVEGAFDKDDKDKKKKARDMMRMMITINQENFDGHRVVTCYSCHRGSNAPVGTPIISDLVPKETPGEMRKGGVVQAKLPPADQIVETYVKVLGGAAAIDKISSRTQKGKIQFAGGEFPIDVFTKDGDKRISFTHMPEGDNITAFNGSEGWLIAPGRPGSREMHGSDLDAAGMDADLHFATHLKQMFSETHVEQGEKIGDHETYLMIGKRENNTVKLYFDQQSGLLVRLVRFGETALGLLPTQIDYSDYRQADGVEVPFRWTLARANGRFTIQVGDMQQNVPVDDAKFVKPPPPPDSGKGPGH
jgi:hypothetical protein